MSVATKGVSALVVVFVGFYMFTDPTGFATFTKEGTGALWTGLEKFFSAVIDFLNAIFS